MPHLAQFNIARLKAPLDSPQLEEFVSFLEPVNRYAEESPGFVWRLTGEDGRSSTFVATPYDDDRIVPNLTVWRDIESLFDFTYRTVHSYFLKSRARWFDRPEGPHLVMWWIAEGEIPDLFEGKERLDRLAENGPSPTAFDTQHLYDADGRLLDHRKLMAR